ncbi:GntR family transcriptional regulator [Halobacillus shinanisalinarum]|uniref:GntR family transcriptional regulator n=1 Tax=Halobacillus shinanisalinarum TaxID=2932258 RepID=A0ABY4H808_9BACI|nr:GntR family transcriptional regulator [Halobacillus shinanisalinarum]UOQ95107.1 GntR family transcriptional regulator [Halobacillus shinanisalinarum]
MDINIKKSSLKYQIAEGIKKEIFQGNLDPGDKVTENYIAKKLEVSRGPVREAIQLLVMEGLLVSVTYKETRVSSITTEEVTELLIPMRINMETFALKKAYSSWNERHFEKFDELVDKMKRATIFNDMPLFNEIDLQFHELIIVSSNMNNLAHLWAGILNRIRLHFVHQNRLSLDLQKFTDEHEILLNTFKTGDLETAVQGLRDHIINTNMPRVELLPDQENEHNKE